VGHNNRFSIGIATGARFRESDILRRSYLPLFVALRVRQAAAPGRQQSPVSSFRVRTANIIQQNGTFGKKIFFKTF